MGAVGSGIKKVWKWGSSAISDIGSSGVGGVVKDVATAAATTAVTNKLIAREKDKIDYPKTENIDPEARKTIMKTDTEIQDQAKSAAEKEKIKRKKLAGRARTIMTGPSGLKTPETELKKKTLLGA